MLFSIPLSKVFKKLFTGSATILQRDLFHLKPTCEMAALSPFLFVLFHFQFKPG